MENIEFAAGLEMRRETFAAEADPRVENNQLIGGEFGSSRGDRSSSELYIESLVPIIPSENIIAEPVLEANISLRALSTVILVQRPTPSWRCVTDPIMT